MMHHDMDMPATHGMLLFGEKTLYLSHLPMFMTEHDHQVIMEVTLTAEEGDAQIVYTTDRQRSEERVYTLVPEQFSLQRLAADGPAKLASFKGTVFRGHFEKDGEPILRDVTVNVRQVIHFRKFDPAAESPPSLSYLLFGRDDEYYLAHFITAAPDFDQIVPVSLGSHDFSEEALNRGVRLAVPGRENRITDRLRDGQEVVAQVDIALQTSRELYLEEGELADPPTFATTDEEAAAGFR